MINTAVNLIFIIVLSIIIISCSIGIVIAIRFQKKKIKKYNECLNIINEKKDLTLQVKDGLTKEEINNIDGEVNVDKLMVELFNTYLELENKVKCLDNNYDDVLIGFLKDFYINKIENFKNKGFADINDSIDLINYSIIEYSKKNLKFRIVINCFSYKISNNKIVSGSNLEKIQKIILLSYEKKDEKWLINSYEKIYEKKMCN